MNGSDTHAHVTALFSMYIVKPTPELLSKITAALDAYLIYRQSIPAITHEAGTGPQTGVFESPAERLCRQVNGEGKRQR
jgi:hypothetical protein